MTTEDIEKPDPVISADTSGPEAGAPEESSVDKELAELKDRLLRALAETENVRRRAEREREDTAKYAVTGFARDVLPVADNLGRALAAIGPDLRGKDPSLDALIAGIELTDRELKSIFERHGIRRIDPLGERFDHNFHQAMMEVEDPTKPPGTVVQVLQAGYGLRDRLLRPAMVAVAKGGRAETSAPAAANDAGHTVDTKA
jgi:molecular chaperone GrpE